MYDALLVPVLKSSLKRLSLAILLVTDAAVAVDVSMTFLATRIRNKHPEAI